MDHYGRDFEVSPRSEDEKEVGDRKKWSVKLEPYSPAAEVVNRQPTLEETEEQVGHVLILFFPVTTFVLFMQIYKQVCDAEFYI